MRIVGGKFKGRKIPVPQKGVRPTSERVREALMSMLGHDWTGLSVLDCFAGSGAMGFEALSRGAQQVHFIDSSSAVCRHLAQVAEMLGVEGQVVIQKGTAEQALKTLKRDSQCFDILFFDPPYGKEHLAIALAHAQELVSVNSVVVAEHEPEYVVSDLIGCLQRTQTRRYGSSSVSFFEVCKDTEANK